MKTDVISLDNKTVGSVELDDAVFGLEPRADLLARVVNWQRAKRRAGTHASQSRGEVTGTGKKPFRQKGTGHARQGSRKGPHFRGGGHAFAKTPRDHEHGLPKKIRKLGLKTALSAKQAEGKLIVLDDAKADSPKTREMAKRLTDLGWDNVLIIGEAFDGTFELAVRNIPRIDLLPEQGANVYDILRRDTLVLTKAAVEKLEARLK